LGFPQGVQKVEDARLNRSGDNPDRERTPALKRIADPANQQSPNPAIKAAAKAKADADLAPQKIKAIKYLATVCCGCAKNKDDVKDALLAALDDCTEEVRYEAAMALCQCAGNVCVTCNSGSCCDAKVMNKLLKVSEGKDEQGCWLEASARVRAVAANGLNACREVRGPQSPTPVEVPKRPPEAPGVLPKDGKAPSNTGSPTPDDSAASARADGRNLARPAGYFGASEGGATPPPALAAPVTDDPSTQLAGLFGRERRICPPGRGREGYYYYTPVEPAAPTTPATPGEKAPTAKPPVAEEAAPPDFGAPSPTALAQGTAMGGVPNMIGDVFFRGGTITIPNPDNTSFTARSNVPIAGGDTLFKVADDNSPIPTDRVFFNYNSFRNALVALDNNPRNFNRFTFGLEKTFGDGCSSVEFQVPFGNGLNSTQSFAPDASLMATEFGNVPVVFKTLLWRNECQACSVGVAAVSPTAGTGRVIGAGGNELLVIQNNAWHIQPFFGWLWTPPERKFFVQVFGEVDFETFGNVVSADTGDGLQPVGRYNDQTLALLDLKVGYWLYRDPCARWVTGIVPTWELHYTTTMQNSDVVALPLGGEVSNPFNRMDVIDWTSGVHFLMGQMSTLTLAASLPLTRNENKMFDAEFFVQFDRRF
jgi:hypothetical protein